MLASIKAVRAELYQEIDDIFAPLGVKVYGHMRMPGTYPKECSVWYIGGSPGTGGSLAGAREAGPFYRFYIRLAVSYEGNAENNAASEDEINDLEDVLFQWLLQANGLTTWRKLAIEGQSLRPVIGVDVQQTKLSGIVVRITPRVDQ